MKFDAERGRVWTAFHEYLRASRAASEAGHTKETRDKVGASLDAYEASMDALVEAASQEQRARAEEAELGCEVLAVGDLYERLASTLEAGKVALRERDAAGARASELEMVVHALMRRLGADDVGLRPEELRQAAADCVLRDLYVVTDPGRGFLEGARVRAFKR